MDHTCKSKILALCAKNNKDRIDMENFEVMLKSPDCPVCRMFVDVVAQKYGTTQRLVSRSKDGRPLPCHLYFTEMDIKEDQDSTDLWKPEVQTLDVSHVSYLPYDDERESYAFGLQLGEREIPSTDPAVNFFKRKHESGDGTIDPEFLALWVSAFKENHKSCVLPTRERAGKPPPGFMLIDVKNMKILEPPDEAKYVALSYVWGAECSSQFKMTTANKSMLQEDQGLSRVWTQIPRTIRDAVTLLQRLDWGFLWVDALCIIQDDLDNKTAQINAMDTIYEGADLVWAAAYGTGANTGLAGTESLRFPLRAKRRRERIHDRVQILSEPIDYEHIPSSVWHTRGWTFQESELARTKLIFTANQAYLQCRCGGVSAESKALDAFHFRNDNHLSLSEVLKPCDDWFGARIHDDRSFWTEYTERLQEYTCRELTLPEDILNAFAAILANLEWKWKEKFLFGLPEQHLASALRWNHGGLTRESRRRDCMLHIQREGKMLDCPAPSWSWAGWFGPVELAPERKTRNSKIEVKWTLSDDKVPLPVNDPMRHTLIQALTPRTFFDVEDDVLNATGTPIGYIDPPRPKFSTVGESGRTKYEFVALSAGLDTFFYRDGERVWDDSEPQVVVEALIIGQRVNGVAFRIGVASINWDDWEASNPTEEFITLG